jgi:EAL domain-containing protein (putative c-di-GMP-specific phosphodiesterase class I)
MIQLIQEDFVEMVAEILEQAKLEPQDLELEITESTLMESYEIVKDKLNILKQKGVKIALDDFGKGYSSLNYLRHLPISTLKIDKSFIDTIGSGSRDESIVGLMVDIGKTMGLSVVAEGVEIREQLDYLKNSDCDKIQGYLFSKPVPEEAVMECLARKEWNI